MEMVSRPSLTNSGRHNELSETFALGAFTFRFQSEVGARSLLTVRLATDADDTGAFLPILAWTLPKGKTMLPFDGKLDPRPAWKRALRMDWIGALLCVGWVTCLGISLQWGGITKKWNSTPVLVVSE
jgi:hypothetical protein